eukprot:2612293-Rhodomonas_salina.3
MEDSGLTHCTSASGIFSPSGLAAASLSQHHDTAQQGRQRGCLIREVLQDAVILPVRVSEVDVFGRLNVIERVRREHAAVFLCLVDPVHDVDRIRLPRFNLACILELVTVVVRPLQRQAVGVVCLRARIEHIVLTTPCQHQTRRDRGTQRVLEPGAGRP